MAKRLHHQQYGAHLTVQLPPEELAEGGQASDVKPIIALLEATRGIAEVRVLQRDEIDRLLVPWLGEQPTALALPLPRLMAVTLDRGTTLDVDSLAERIRRIAPEAIVVNHKENLESLIDLAGWIRAVSAGVIVMIGLSACLMAILMTKMGLAAHAPVIELLHLMGAEDGYVAAQFQRHALTGGLTGGLVGLVFSVSTIAVIEEVTRGIDRDLVPDLSLSAPQWAVLFALPLAAAAVTTLTVRYTVLRGLAGMP